jgi:NTP pyrophosphatase (non-canonical NTP hydrolase)
MSGLTSAEATAADTGATARSLEGLEAAAPPLADASTPVATIRAALARFVAERDWDRFHRPRDLAMAVSVEAGELLELFLWVDPGTPGGRPDPDPARVEAEVADVAICLLNLCNRAGIDLAAAVARKLEHNAAKYPVAKARGSALKYDEFP